MEHQDQVVQTCPDVQLPVHIYQAAVQGNVDVMQQWLCDHPKCINARTDFNYTLLDAACINGQKEVLETLLEYSNLDLNVRDELGRTPLIKSLTKKQMNCVEALINSSKQNILINPCNNDNNGNCPLWMLVERSRWDLIPSLLGRHLNGYSTSMLEDTWQMATLSGHYHIVSEIAEYLITRSFEDKKWKNLKSYLKDSGQLHSVCDDIINAVHMDDSQAIYDLLKNKSFSTLSLDTALDLATRFNRTDVIEPLLIYHTACDIAVLKKTLDTLIGRNALTLIEILLKHHIQKFNYESLCQAKVKSQTHRFDDTKAFLDAALDAYRINYKKRLSDVSKSESESAYDNSSDPRGHVCIFNYTKNRPGAEYDSANIKNIFESFNYKVINYTNLTKSQTLDAINCIICNTELRHVDSLIVFILSHGKSKYEFTAVDGEIINLEKDIRCKFTNDLCPYLKDKPKIFLPNYCRTKNMICERPSAYDLPPRHQSHAMMDATFISQISIDENNFEDLKVPSYVEILRDAVTIHAATDGISALREIDKGTIFIYSLCDVLQEVQPPRELMHVYRKLHERMKQNKGTTPEFEGVLSKVFYFTPDCV